MHGRQSLGHTEGTKMHPAHVLRVFLLAVMRVFLLAHPVEAVARQTGLRPRVPWGAEA